MLLLMVLTGFPYVIAGTLIALLTFAIVREDLIAKMVTERLTMSTECPEIARDAEWMDVAESLDGLNVWPVVLLQVLLNRVQDFRSDTLEPLRKRLETAEKRLNETMFSMRRVSIAHKWVTYHNWNSNLENIKHLSTDLIAGSL